MADRPDTDRVVDQSVTTGPRAVGRHVGPRDPYADLPAYAIVPPVALRSASPDDGSAFEPAPRPAPNLFAWLVTLSGLWLLALAVGAEALNTVLPEPVPEIAVYLLAGVAALAGLAVAIWRARGFGLVNVVGLIAVGAAAAAIWLTPPTFL